MVVRHLALGVLMAGAAAAQSSPEPSPEPPSTGKQPPAPEFEALASVQPRMPAKLSTDKKWLQRDFIRPGHTTKLTKDTFDDWIKGVVDSKKTAFVRWLSTDETTDCSHISARLRHAVKLDQNQTPEAHCALLAKASHAWYHATKVYKGNDRVVFGDVVISDYKDLVAQVQAQRKEQHDLDWLFHLAFAAGKDPPESNDLGQPNEHLQTIFGAGRRTVCS